MISKETLSGDWLEKVSAENRKADKILVEKVIRALLLLEGLVKSNLHFVFKGGTALMLLVNSTRRLSIDIDIIISEHQELDELFISFLEEQGFTRFEIQKRKTATDIKKAHYKFFYTPVHDYGMTEDYVLLDILFEEPHYTNIIEVPIISSFLIQEGEPVVVKIPSYEDILGDKLTAFAPNTTGIPYEKNGDSRSMEIIKQLYDVGSLLDYATDPQIVAKTFDIFAQTELGYRQMEMGTREVLDDVYQTSLHICSRGVEGNGNYDLLAKGITQVKRFISRKTTIWTRPLSTLPRLLTFQKSLCTNKRTSKKYTGAEDIKEFMIEQPFNTKFNKLKKGNPEAFFYWYQVSLLENSAS